MADKAVVDTQGPNIDSILNEQRRFEPPAAFSKLAHVKSLAEYEALYKESIDDPDKFWSRIASELHWFKKWDKVLEWNCPWAKWFVGGKLNVAVNCVDRHVEAGHGEQVAFHWEGEPGDSRTITYADLQREVNKTANALAELGVDRSSCYVTNAVKHFRFTQDAPGKRRIHQTPDAVHVEACKPWLLAELAVVDPEVVVLLGATAGRALLGPTFRVTRDRGRLIPRTARPDEPAAWKGGWLLATLHPSAILRADDREAAYEGFLADLRVLMSV